jgi:Na+/H+-translocating membrane pyrophosphatase
MAADVFETYAVSLIGAVLVGALTLKGIHSAIIFPFVIGGISILASIIGIIYVNYSRLRPGTALMAGVGVSTLVSAILFIPVTRALFPVGSPIPYSQGGLYLSAVVGLFMTAIVVLITNYYTSTGLFAGPADCQSLRDRPRDKYHRRARRRACTRPFYRCSSFQRRSGSVFTRPVFMGSRSR